MLLNVKVECKMEHFPPFWTCCLRMCVYSSYSLSVLNVNIVFALHSTEHRSIGICKNHCILGCFFSSAFYRIFFFGIVFVFKIRQREISVQRSADLILLPKSYNLFTAPSTALKTNTTIITGSGAKFACIQTVTTHRMRSIYNFKSST